MRYCPVVFLICLSMLWISCKESDNSNIINSQSLDEPQFVIHDPSNIIEIAPNVFSSYTSTHPDNSHHMRQIILDMNKSNPQWEENGIWPIEPRGQNPIPGFMEWEIEWWEEYGYNRNLIEHTELATVAPTIYNANTVYFNLRNVPARQWAYGNDLEPAMFFAIHRATASGTWPGQSWTMEPIPVYYSDNGTFDMGGPRAVDCQVWDDDDGQMYMTFGSWDPANKNVIAIADMDESTGRIEGFDAETPGYYSESNLAFHPVSTFGEGAQSYKYGDYYYLFINLGSCCDGLNSTYFIVVGRSTDIYGPYVDEQGRDFMDVYPDNGQNHAQRFPGKFLIGSKGKYLGPGHTGIYEHSNGKIAISFHYYDGTDSGVSRFTSRELAFNDDGWPFIVSDKRFDFED
jgi:hypothetical protein